MKEEVERLSTQQKEVPRFPILRLRCPFSKERFPLDGPCEAPESPSHWRAAAASLLGQASPPKTMMRSPMMKHQKSALASPEARPRPCCFGPNPLLERGAGLPPLSEAAAGEQRAPSAAGTGASLVRLALSLSLKSSGGGHKKGKRLVRKETHCRPALFEARESTTIETTSLLRDLPLLSQIKCAARTAEDSGPCPPRTMASWR